VAKREQQQRDLLSMMGGAAWRSIAVTLAGVALLMALQQVVRAGMQRGEVRRQAVATRADNEWRCRVMRVARERVDCLLQLEATPTDAAGHAAAIALQ
jgi:hypothetical protein